MYMQNVMHTFSKEYIYHDRQHTMLIQDSDKSFKALPGP